MGFLAWLEATGFPGEWVRSSTAGYPSMIALHALGMALMVGLSLLLDLRILGWFAGIPLQSLRRFFGLAWIGFGINFISGSALFSIAADPQAATRIAEGVTRGPGLGLKIVRSFARGRGPISG